MSITAEKIAWLFDECKNYETSIREKGETKLLKTTKNRQAEMEKRKKNKISVGNNFANGNENFTTNSESNDSREILSRDIAKLISGNKIRTTSVEFSSLNKMMAMSCFAEGDETAAIGYLIESHAVILQQHICHRYIKSQVRKQYLNQLQESGLKPIHMKIDPQCRNGDDSLGRKLSEMPQEWYTVQVTVAYKEPYLSRGNDSVLDTVLPLHVTVLPTGKNTIEPLCVTVPSPNYGEYQTYDALEEIVKIQKNNKADLEAYYRTNKSYWEMREKQNNRMKTAVKELEYSWLREWRILLMADTAEDTKLVKEMKQMIDKLIADDLSIIDVSPRTRWLLKKIATSCCYLTREEIARAVRYVLRDSEKLANNIILSIHGKLQNVNDLRTEKRKTLVLIVDECIDHIPFESMDVLKYHPVTRFPSFHIAFAMFKEHEDTIVEGCKVVKNTKEFGTFIINPGNNLDKMEKRMKLFVKYWLPHWKGLYGRTPDEVFFENVLVNHDVLLYSGHGSGIQYLLGEKIERLRVRATVFLFGCSSVKLNSVGGRFPPYGVSNQYLIACSPCVLGMLWEVTDGDIDRMTACFMSDWIPSVAAKPWSSVHIDKWCDGVLKFESAGKKNAIRDCTNEPELLRAVAKSKDVCTQHMTAAAIVVRGLPIRLE